MSHQKASYVGDLSSNQCFYVNNSTEIFPLLIAISTLYVHVKSFIVGFMLPSPNKQTSHLSLSF